MSTKSRADRRIDQRTDQPGAPPGHGAGPSGPESAQDSMRDPTHETGPVETRPPARSRAGMWTIPIAIVLALVGAFIMHQRSQSKTEGAPAAAGADGERGSARGGRGAAGAGERSIPVLVVPVARRDVPITTEGLGSVVAYKTVNVRTQVDGRLDRVAFREGQAVKRGELLAQVDPRPFEIQLHQAEAALARDTAQLSGAELNLKRYEAVVTQRLIPQQQVDDQRALVDQLKGTIQSDQAQIENAKLQLVYARITSPIDGVTGIRLVDAGNLVHAADPTGIVVVTQLDPIAILFTLPQDELPRVVKSQAAGAPRGRGAEPGRRQRHRHRRAGAGRQPDQPEHGDDPAQGHLSQSVALAVAQPVREDAAAPRCPQGRAGGAGGGGAARPAGDVRLRRHRRRQGAGEAGPGRHDRGGERADRQGHRRRRSVVTEGQNQLRPDARVTVRQPGGSDTGGDSGAAHPGGGGKRPGSKKPK